MTTPSWGQLTPRLCQLGCWDSQTSVRPTTDEDSAVTSREQPWGEAPEQMLSGHCLGLCRVWGVLHRLCPDSSPADVAGSDAQRRKLLEVQTGMSREGWASQDPDGSCWGHSCVASSPSRPPHTITMSQLAASPCKNQGPPPPSHAPARPFPRPAGGSAVGSESPFPEVLGVPRWGRCVQASLCL